MMSDSVQVPVIDEAMMASSLIDDSMIDGSYDPYGEMSTLSANLCDVVQDDDIDLYGAADDDIYSNRVKRLICRRCGKAFRNRALLKKHAAMHDKDLQYECTECKKRFSRKESLTRHQLVHNGMKFFECPECGRMFNQNGHLKTHMLVHTKEKNYECEECEMRFARKDNMKRHSLLHSRKKQHECTVCKARFTQFTHLAAHMVTHTHEKNYQCSQCLMKFARRDTLKRHMLVHTKEKSFECEFCTEKFFQKAHLKAHILVHTKEKKFDCPECDKKFARKGSLQRHVLGHTGERSFECLECGKGFIQKTHLNKHMAIHQGKGEGENGIVRIRKPRAASKPPVKSEINSEVGNPPQLNNAAGSVQPTKIEKDEPEEHHDNGQQTVTPAPADIRVGQMVDKTTSTVFNEKEISVSVKPTSSEMKNDTTDSKNTGTVTVTPTPTPKVSSEQVGNSQPIRDGSRPSQQAYAPQNLATSKGNSTEAGGGTAPQDVSQMQPSNLIANSNSVMALALIDHFLTGNESQEAVPVAVAGPSAKAKAANQHQWTQKTQQELLAAQTLSAIGQRTTTANETNAYHVTYGHAPFVNSQVSSNYTPQSVPHVVFDSGSNSGKIRLAAHPEWVAQDSRMVHPHGNVYNAPPPPAHEVFRYYAPVNVTPSGYATQSKDGLVRLPDGAAIPADMRASPRKPKFPQKVIVPLNESQPALSVAHGVPHQTHPMYAHSKQLIEHTRQSK